MFIQIFNPNQSVKSVPTGALQSPLIAPTSTPNCFSFYYYIYGADANKTDLYLSSQSQPDHLIWSRHYPAGDMWYNYMINIPPQNAPFRVSNTQPLNNGRI